MRPSVLLCGTLYAVIAVLSLIDTLKVDRQPCGPKMCYFIWAHVFDGLLISFTPSTLRCQLSTKRAEKTTDENVTCPDGAKRILSRTRGLLCVQWMARTPTETATNRQREKETSRFSLIVSSSAGKFTDELYKVKVQRSSPVIFKYHYLKVRLIRAMAYSPEARLLFLSAGQTGKFLSHVMYKKGVSVLMEAVKSYHLALDDGIKRLFYVRYHSNSVESVSFNGISMTILKKSFANILSISLDRVSKKVYVTGGVAVYNFDYYGKNQRQVRFKASVFSLVVDDVRRMFYFDNGQCLHERSMLNESSSQVGQFCHPIGHVRVYDQSIVGSYARRIFILNPMMKSVTRMSIDVAPHIKNSPLFEIIR